MRTANLLPLLLVLAGCSGGDPAEQPEAEPPKATLKGKPDPALAGGWRMRGGDTTYDLRADGSYHFRGANSYRGSTLVNEYDGKWSADADAIYLADKAGNVAVYDLTREGKNLKLTARSKSKRVTYLEPK